MITPPTPSEAEAIARRIAEWAPRRVADPDPAVVAAARQLVADADPQSLSQVSQVLAHLFNFLAWRARHAPEVIGTDEALTARAVEDYKDAPDGLGSAADGTRRAAVSYLNRLVPGAGGLVSPASAKRKVVACPTPTEGDQAPQVSRDSQGEALVPLKVLQAAESARPDPATPATVRLDEWLVGLDPGIAELIRDYNPKHLPTAATERVGPVVRAAVAAARPASTERARAQLRVGFYLAAWVLAADRPVRPDVVFAPATVAEFLQLADSRLGSATAATFRGLLLPAAAAMLPDADFSGLPRFKRTRAKAPAGDKQVQAMLRWAAHRGRPTTRRHSKAMIVLAVGAGLDGGESPWVRPRDLMWTRAGRAVALHRPGPGGQLRLVRVALVTEAWEGATATLFADAAEAGEDWLLGPGRPREGRATDLRGRTGSEVVDLMALRNRWIVDLAATSRLSLPGLLATAGFDSLEVFKDLRPHMNGPKGELAPFEDLR